MTSKQRYLEVIVNVPLNQTFTYLEPEDSSEEGKNTPENPFGCRVEEEDKRRPYWEVW